MTECPPPRVPTALPAAAAFALLLGLALAVFGPAAWHAELLNYRDAVLFGGAGRDAALAARGPLGLLDPTSALDGAFTPLAHLSLWLDLQVFGGGPAATGAHLHSLLWRTLAAWLLARLAVRLGLAPRAAVAAAALWLVHPALAESAAVVADRRDALGALLGFAALGAVARDGSGPRRAAIAAALVAAAGYAAVPALAAGALAPIAAAVARSDRRAFAAPAVAALATAAVVGMHHAALGSAVGFEAAGLAHLPGLVGRDLAVAVWPVGLNLLHPEVAALEALALPAWAALVALAGAAAALLAIRRRAPTVGAVALAWFVAGVTVHGLLPADGPAVADGHAHWTVAILAVAFAALPRIGTALVAILIVPAAIATAGRARELADSRSAWAASLATAPDGAVAALNLAHARAAVGDLDVAAWRELATRAARTARRPEQRLQAEQALVRIARREDDREAAADHAVAAAEAAMALGDDLALGGVEVEARLEAARLARRAGREAVARQQFERAQQLAPAAAPVLAFQAALLHAEAMLDATGRVAADDARIAAATTLLDRAAAADPDLYDVPWTRGVLAHATGRLLEAEKQFRAAIAIDPGRPEAHLARTDLFLGQAGMAEAAERAAREGLDAARATGALPDAGLRHRLALALTQQGRIDDARDHYERYLELRPDDAQARTGLATVLASIGMRQLHRLPPDKIEELAERVLELDPDHPKGQLLRAILFRTQARLAEALILFERVREALPDDADVARLYAETLRDRAWQLKLGDDAPERAWPLFRRFLDAAPPGVDTQAAETALLHEWGRELRAGQDALLAGDLDVAERSFRRCLELRPEAASPNLQLGMTLLQRGGEQVATALACFERAERGQRAAGFDPTLAIYYQVRALRLAGDDAAARARGQGYLREPVEGADPDALERLRALLDG